MKRFGIAALAAVALLASGCTRVPSAQKNGTIVKLAKQGIFFKTWEAEIVRGGSFTGGTGVQGAPFDFTISDPALLAKVKAAFENQQEVRITYHQSWPAPFSSDSDGNFLDSIEVVSAEQGGTVRPTGPEPQRPIEPGEGVTAGQFQQALDQNARALDQNERLLKVVEKSLAGR